MIFRWWLSNSLWRWSKSMASHWWIFILLCDGNDKISVRFSHFCSSSSQYSLMSTLCSEWQEFSFLLFICVFFHCTFHFTQWQFLVIFLCINQPFINNKYVNNWNNMTRWNIFEYCSSNTLIDKQISCA